MCDGELTTKKIAALTRHHARQADLANGLLPANTNRPLTHAEVLRDFAGVIPYSHAQPYLRVQSVDAPMNDETTSELAVGKRVRAEAEGKQEQTGQCRGRVGTK